MRLRCPPASCSAISLLQYFGLFFRHTSNLPPNQLTAEERFRRRLPCGAGVSPSNSDRSRLIRTLSCTAEAVTLNTPNVKLLSKPIARSKT